MWQRYLKMGAISILVGLALSLLALGMAQGANITPPSGCAMLSGLKPSDLVHFKKPFYDKGTGMLMELFDRDKNGVPDLAFLSQVKSLTWIKGELFVEKADYPTFYFLGEGPDYVYIDVKGVGNCKDVVLYENLLQPHDPGVNFDEMTLSGRGRAI